MGFLVPNLILLCSSRNPSPGIQLYRRQAKLWDGCGESQGSGSQGKPLLLYHHISAGALVLVINYTGDRINFGLAVEKARSEGLKVYLEFFTASILKLLKIFLIYFNSTVCTNPNSEVVTNNILEL